MRASGQMACQTGMGGILGRMAPSMMGHGRYRLPLIHTTCSSGELIFLQLPCMPGERSRHAVSILCPLLCLPQILLRRQDTHQPFTFCCLQSSWLNHLCRPCTDECTCMPGLFSYTRTDRATVSPVFTAISSSSGKRRRQEMIRIR